ncbi:MAG: nitronate monooxygenase, partial [Planctomycetota bacterium]|nr:nitronate monooxygenase [Planctomycetota bacterium]
MTGATSPRSWQALPRIVQGGMGVAVSGWRLAQAVSRTGQLGVVAGTGLDLVLARRLGLGDPGGHMRRALAHFPIPGVAERVLATWFQPEGKADDAGFRPSPMPAVNRSQRSDDLVVAANFVEVFLAREGHANPVGINFLQKIQLPTLPSLFGAMLAGVDVVLMGAGIPKDIPGTLDGLARGEPVELRIEVADAGPEEEHLSRFDPAAFCGSSAPALARPRFFAIIASNTMARVMATKSNGTVDGFVIEGPTAGGHNAPPRGRLKLTDKQEPAYGARDVPDLEAIAKLGIPFWLAGSQAEPEQLTAARAQGAAGVQLGTAFAYCEESGLDPDIKRRVLARSARREVETFTDPLASPTGFPFKVVQLDGTLSDATTYAERSRRCDVGQLRHAYTKADGSLGWRCAGEPVDAYVRKGGAIEDTVGRKCVCNGLLAAIGLGQVDKHGNPELPIVTSGNDVADV